MTGPHYCIGDCRRAETRIGELEALLEQTRYQVDHWKREACQLVHSDRTNLIQQHFDLTPEEAIICNALYQRRDKWLPGPSIEGLLDEYRGGAVEASLVSQMVSRIRRKLGDGAIENARGRGYRISPDLLRQMEKALK